MSTVLRCGLISMLPRVTSDPDLCAEKVTRVRMRRFSKHTSYSEQLNHGKSSIFRQMEKTLIEMSKITKMSPRGDRPSPDVVECRKIRRYINIPPDPNDRLEVLRIFRKEYSGVRIYSWNLRLINAFRGDGRCWIVILYIEDTDKK